MSVFEYLCISIYFMSGRFETSLVICNVTLSRPIKLGIFPCCGFIEIYLGHSDFIFFLGQEIELFRTMKKCTTTYKKPKLAKKESTH